MITLQISPEWMVVCRLGGCSTSTAGIWLTASQGREGGDLKDSEVAAYIDFSLSDPLAGGCSSLKVSN